MHNRGYRGSYSCNKSKSGSRSRSSKRTPSTRRAQKLHEESVNMHQGDAAREYQDLCDNYQLIMFHCSSLLDDSPAQKPSTTSMNNTLATRKPSAEPFPSDTDLEGKRSIETYLKFQRPGRPVLNTMHSTIYPGAKDQMLPLECFPECYLPYYNPMEIPNQEHLPPKSP